MGTVVNISTVVLYIAITLGISVNIGIQTLRGSCVLVQRMGTYVSGMTCKVLLPRPFLVVWRRIGWAFL